MKKISKHNNRLYNIWYNMKRRCYNKNAKDYKNYGNKGIKVCKEWEEEFMVFYEWALNNGYDKKLTLDRIDNNKNYCPENCRWITIKEQHRNYSQNRNYTINGETKCVTEWCELYNIKFTTVINRLNKGMNIIEALTKPINKNKIPMKYRKEE